MIYCGCLRLLVGLGAVDVLLRLGCLYCLLVTAFPLVCCLRWLLLMWFVFAFGVSFVGCLGLLAWLIVCVCLWCLRA